MFESAELGHKVDAETYDAEVHHLRERLLRAQAEVFRKKAFPVIVVISGFEAAGKGDTLHTLHEWMDSRHIETHAFDRPDCVERRHPAMWRFWQALPRAGDVGIFFGAWYRSTLYVARLRRREARRARAAARADRPLRADADRRGGAPREVLAPPPKKEQRKKLEELESNRRTRWRVKASDWSNHERYGEFRKAAEEMLHQTSSHQAPWIVVEGTDDRYRRLTVAARSSTRCAPASADHAQVHVSAPPIVTAVDNRKLLRDLDFTKALAKNEYERRLAKAQGALAR